MRHLVILAAFGVLAACVEASEPAAQPAAPPAEAAALEGVRAPDLRVSCNAGYLQRCGDAGCVGEGEGAGPSIPVAFNYDGATGAGELCMATGCHAVVIAAFPGDALDADEAVSGAVVDPGGEGEPANYNGVVTIARDGSTFQFISPGVGDISVWGGACERTPELGAE